MNENKTVALLRLLNEKFPISEIPDSKFQPKHNITLSDRAGLMDVTIMFGGLWHTFAISAEEMEEPDLLVDLMFDYLD